MEFVNYTPFEGNAWDTVNCHNQWHCTTMVRVRFVLRKSPDYSVSNPKWVWHLHPDQGELFSEDMFHQGANEQEQQSLQNKVYQQCGDAELGSVRYESDYVNFKPNTDIIFNAISHAPEQMPAKSWTCGVSVYTTQQQMTEKRSCNELLLQVQGPKHLLSRQKIDELPIRYEYSRGGIQSLKHKNTDKQQINLDLYNPIGVGSQFMDKLEDGLKNADTSASHLSPSVQIEYIKDADKHAAPPGFGFIHRGWRSRLQYAGTYDDKWLEQQHPLPPYDFDFKHHQAAHPNLVVDGYLAAGACIEWQHLQAGEPRGYCIVPEYRLLSRVHTELNTLHDIMNLDTIVFDLDGGPEKEPQVYASWRAYTPIMAQATRSEAMLLPNEQGAQQQKVHKELA